MPLDYRPAGFVAEVLIGGPTESNCRTGPYSAYRGRW